MNRRDFLTKAILAAGTTAIAGCRGFEAAEHRYQLAPENVLPADIAKAPAEVREAYRFAITNRDTLRYIPWLLRLRRRGPHEQCIVLSQRQLDPR